MIDPERLNQQRLEIESLRLETERLEAQNRLRAAELEAVRLGIRRECVRGCGRVIAGPGVNRSGVCTRCARTEWQARKRAEERGTLRLVGGAA